MKTPIILCPVDFSTLGKAAVQTATSLARDRGAKLLIVHVQEPFYEYGNGEFYYGLVDPDRAELEKMLNAIVPSDPAVAYEHRLIVGNPSEAVLELADQEQVEMIVIATHGRTGVSRLLMGSVAEAIVRKAKCPVLTIKASAAPPAKRAVTKEPGHEQLQ
jgi:nucleotide-binding universal stress UspA family protein